MIDEAILNKLNSDEMFTLFDITLDVQKMQAKEGEPLSKHRELHNQIADAANMTGWSRKLIDIGDGIHANVYFNTAIHDVSTYQSKKMIGKDQPILMQDGSIRKVKDIQVGDQLMGTDGKINVVNTSSCAISTKSVDRFGRLRIPSAITRKAGYVPGDILYAIKENDNLIIAKNLNIPVAKYVVDCYDNVRITSKTLKKVGLDGNFTYSFNVNGNKIIISK
jgi:bifunctional DNA-binding transcriptional regulator/antitoxin component of YhaV-PrlF toxin-antitoxin module